MKKKSKSTNELKEIKISPLWRKLLLFLALVFIGLFFAHKIFFINADLGRHIKNGEMIFSPITDIKLPLTTNFYSYTEPNFPLINHHWGSGVVFYIIWKFFGFSGLTFFHILLNVFAAFFFFRIAEKKSNFVPAFTCLVLSIPLITGRTEIRPEAFSYLFAGIFYYFLSLFDEGKFSFRKILFILLPLQLLWVNLHIFFILGIFLIGVFWLNAVIKKKFLKEYSVLFVAALILCIINPNGINGFLEPFMILREYGYMIAENQSLFFIQKRFPENKMYYHFEILFAVTVFCLFILFIKNRKNITSMMSDVRLPVYSSAQFNPQLIIFIFFSFLAIKMVRGIPLWGLFFIPFSATVFNKIMENNFRDKTLRLLKQTGISIAVIIIFSGLFTRNNYYSPWKGFSGLSLLENVNRSAEFIKKNNLEGPIFNNYDIGGYFIFNLFPQHKVFVDNRPEAYSVDFFKKKYEPMQESEESWKKISASYNFNCIYFYRHDNTPNAQPFLISRINDDEWSPVFVDDFTIIFLKRNEKNSALIKKFELPKSMFASVPQ